MTRTLEIRSYTLKAGTRAAFHTLFVDQSLPMLQRWRVDVVAYGPSLHDEDSYYLMRAYASLEDRQESQDAFYGSAEWREGPRAGIIALIQDMTSFVIAVDDQTLAGLRGHNTLQEAVRNS
ncbi:MAG: NIPSNAP family protein [Chloroflexi bacterium]|nr:NIPSNAP family protein [Chloroflexota bacterium]